MSNEKVFKNVETLGTIAGVVSAVCGVVGAVKKCYDTQKEHQCTDAKKKAK